MNIFDHFYKVTIYIRSIENILCKYKRNEYTFLYNITIEKMHFEYLVTVLQTKKSCHCHISFALLDFAF